MRCPRAKVPAAVRAPKGAGEGGQVAVIWNTPTEQEGWNNATPGSVEDIKAETLAEARDEYKALAALGDQPIPTIVLNSDYAPYKGYITARAKELTAAGAHAASERYAVATGLGLLLLYEDMKKREKKETKGIDDREVLGAKQAVARSVLLMMPDFDVLAREAGLVE